MTEELDTRDKFDRLVEVALNLESKVLQLESDIYDMKKRNSEMSRRLSNLESSNPSMRMPPF